MGKMAGLGGVLGPLLGMFGQQQTNQSNQQAQQQALQQAMQMMQQATGQAYGQQQGANQGAMSALQNYFKANPNPASTWGTIQGPQQFGGQQGISMPGGPGLMPGNIPRHGADPGQMFDRGFRGRSPQPPGFRGIFGGGGFSNPGQGGFSNPGGGQRMTLPIMLGGGGGQQMQPGPVMRQPGGATPNRPLY